MSFAGNPVQPACTSDSPNRKNVKTSRPGNQPALSIETSGGIAMIRHFVDDAYRTLGKELCGVCTLAIAIFFCAGVTSAQITNRRQTNLAAPVQQGSREKKTASPAAEQSPAHKYFTDVVLVNQNGEKMRFYSDLLQGKVVIINSFFGTCQGTCLPMNRNLEKVQEALGERMGKDVRIISISVDPLVD